MPGITKGQVAKIWCLARDLHLDRHSLHEYVGKITGSDSISALDKKQGMDVIDGLLSMTGAVPDTRGMASPEQLWMISELAAQLGWDSNPRRLRAFVLKYAKVSEVHWLRRTAASKVIEGLNGIRIRSASLQ